jgi:hypothetical protein
MNLIPVEGQKDLYRDPKTNAIVNTNEQDYQNYISRKKNLENEKVKLETIENDISNLKNDLSEIKSLLRSLINESK